jgi:two-component system, response regulator
MPCEPQSTILVVDDSPNDVALLQRAFDRVGVQNPLAVCKGGDEAIQYLLSHELPCVMLLDLRMPATNGFDVLKRVKADPKLKELIVIVLTTSGEVSDIRRAYELGANSFLTKPVNLDEFQDMVSAFHKYWVMTNRPAPQRSSEGGEQPRPASPAS